MEQQQQPPPAKRARTAMTVAVEDGDAAGEPSPPPVSPKLRPAFLVVLFAVRMIVMNPVPDAAPTISQIEDTVQRIVDCAFKQFHEMVSSKLEKAFQVFQGQIDSIHHEVRQLACRRFNHHSGQHTRLEQNQEDAAANGSNTDIRLRFLNDDFKLPIYTDKNITDKNNADIKVAIFEGGNMITSGPLSKVKVEILVLRGEFCNNERDDWTEEEFENHIVQGRDEQGLLGTVRLTDGVAELSQIRFKKGSCRKNVIMAARVCKGENIALRVQGAIMKPVVVLDRRNEANEKMYPPSLDDDVFRLEEIARNGPYCRRLKKEGIFTVQDFLKALNKDPSKLRKTLKMENQKNSWLKLTRHARQCVLEDKPELKRYQSEEGNVVLFFDCVHGLVGAAFGSYYVASANFSPDQKALVNKWKGHAYDKLEGIASDYIVKGSVPQRISPSPDDAAGPSVPAFSAPQPNFTASQGTGVAENSHRGDIISYTMPPIHINGNSDAMIIPPGYLNTNDYQAQGTALPAQQLIIPESTMPSCQQNDETLMDPYCTFDCTSTDAFLVSMREAGGCFCFIIGAPQPSCREHGQGPSCSAFPGSGLNNDC